MALDFHALLLSFTYPNCGKGIIFSCFAICFLYCVEESTYAKNVKPPRYLDSLA